MRSQNIHFLNQMIKLTTLNMIICLSHIHLECMVQCQFKKLIITSFNLSKNTIGANIPNLFYFNSTLLLNNISLLINKRLHSLYLVQRMNILIGIKKEHFQGQVLLGMNLNLTLSKLLLHQMPILVMNYKKNIKDKKRAQNNIFLAVAKLLKLLT